jgi:hypothetical protein
MSCLWPAVARVPAPIAPSVQAAPCVQAHNRCRCDDAGTRHFALHHSADLSNLLLFVCRRKEGPGVVVAGRPAEVDLALGQDDVRALAMSKASERGPRDNRRLALAKEGAIAEGSPAWTDMPAADRAKRKRAAGVAVVRILGAVQRSVVCCQLCALLCRQPH